MANILIYNKDNGRVIEYKKSMDTVDFLERDDVLINPEVKTVKDISREYVIVDDGKLREMTDKEKEVIDSEQELEAIAIKTESINNLDITIKEAFIAWLELYNSKVPVQYRVTKAEMLSKVLENEGL